MDKRVAVGLLCDTRLSPATRPLAKTSPTTNPFPQTSTPSSTQGGTTTRQGGYNLIGNTAGSYGWGTNDLLNVTNPGLVGLGDYGGPTKTVALASNSPAIGKGTAVDNPVTNKPLTTDQRGFRLDTPNPDIGAYQFQKKS
jgi:hypothetical protein